MTLQQEYFLRRTNLPIYIWTIEDLVMLQEIVDEELRLRNSIDSKVKAITLAEKVEKETGNDQHLPALKQDLFLARQTYAKRLSAFDDQKYNVSDIPYNNATGLPYGSEDEQEELLKPLNPSENHLRPIPNITMKSTPVWEVTSVNADGTTEHLGYSGGQ